MRWHPVASRHLFDLVASSLDEHRSIISLFNLLPVKAERHDNGLVGVVRASVSVIPLLFKPCKHLRLMGLIDLDIRSRHSAVAKKRTRLQFGGPCQPDSVSRQGSRHKACHSIRRKPTKSKNLVLSILGDVNLRLDRSRRFGVVVAELAVRETLHLHPRRMQWDQFAHAALPAALNQGIGITPEQKPTLE